MASTSRSGEDERNDEVHLWREGDSWVARDVETGVASQGKSRDEALEMLDEAVALHEAMQVAPSPTRTSKVRVSTQNQSQTNRENPTRSGSTPRSSVSRSTFTGREVADALTEMGYAPVDRTTACGRPGKRVQESV